MKKEKEVCYVYPREFDGKFYVRAEDFKEIMGRVINQRAENEKLVKENRKLKETIKDHQLYEEKLEHRIIEFEELLHGE